MAVKRYPVQFFADSIQYTAQLSLLEMQELLTIFMTNADPNNSMSLFYRNKIRAVGDYLNQSRIDKPIPDLEGDTELEDRQALYVALGNAVLVAAQDKNPDWESLITDEQKGIVNQFRGLVSEDGVLKVKGDQEVVVVEQ
jgi:hypothetical protein